VTPLEAGDLRCSVCALPVPAVAGAPVEAKERARVLRCKECNAAVEFSPDAQAPRCAFCGSVMEVDQPVDPVEQAQICVPFAVDREAATVTLRSWLSTRGWFAPRTLANDAVVDSMAPLYWAGWVVDARVGVTWTADSDAGSGRSSWAPHAGEFQTQFGNLVIPASRGLTMPECSQLAGHYDLSRAVPIANRAEDDPAVVEGFDAQRSAARALVHEAINALAAVRAEQHIPGSRFRNVRVSCLVDSQTTDRAAFPAWVLAYRYHDRPYRAVIHGQRASIVIGKAPRDRGKVAMVVIASVLAAVAILALVLHFAGHRG
jgi:hypothetical protein